MKLYDYNGKICRPLTQLIKIKEKEVLSVFNRCNPIDCYTNIFEKLESLNIDEILAIIACKLYNLIYQKNGTLFDPIQDKTYQNASELIDILDERRINGLIDLIMKRHWQPVMLEQQDKQWISQFELLDQNGNMSAISVGISDYRTDALVRSIALALIGGLNPNWKKG